MREAYLDNSATTRCFPEVVELMNKIYLEEYGNPSSMHHKGVEAEKHITQAAKILAQILKVNERNLVFTSCGTESDNIAIIGGALANMRRGRHLITSMIEHPAVTESMKYLESQGFEVTYLPVDEYGIVSPDLVEEAVRDDTILVSIMHTNNEIGAVEPIKEIAKRINAKNPSALFHVDAVQGFGKAQIYPKKWGVDLLSVSGHKIHAPKGTGFLYIGDKVKVKNLMFGGGQQNGMRSGTQNVAGIAAMGLAAQMLYQDFDASIDRLYGLRELFLEQVKDIPDLRVNGPKGKKCAPHIISLTVPGVRAEVLLHALEEKGVYVSAGSACASNKPHTSATLEAIRLPRAYLDNTVRISLSEMTTEEDILRGASQAFQGGWNKVKLYFMLGQPTETEEDRRAIAHLAEKIAELYYDTVPKENRSGRCMITISTSFFVPKPFTPFQWAAMFTPEDYLTFAHTVNNEVKASLNHKSIRYNWHEAYGTVLEGLLARGDRRVSRVIEAAYRKGALFDAWTEHWDWNRWVEAMEETGIDLSFYTRRQREEDELFPWDFIDAGPSKRFLLEEWHKAMRAEVTLNCHKKCSACGAAKFGCGVCFDYHAERSGAKTSEAGGSGMI